MAPCVRDQPRHSEAASSSLWPSSATRIPASGSISSDRSAVTRRWWFRTRRCARRASALAFMKKHWERRGHFWARQSAESDVMRESASCPSSEGSSDTSPVVVPSAQTARASSTSPPGCTPSLRRHR